MGLAKTGHVSKWADGLTANAGYRNPICKESCEEKHPSKTKGWIYLFIYLFLSLEHDPSMGHALMR